MWGAFNIYSGMPYETGFPYYSETTTWQRGFLNIADTMRIHTNTFYQVSYLLGEITHHGGSYVPFQVVYALLWWARGFLVFVLLRKFLPRWQAVAYVAGALVLVHAADGSLQWVGQMNQFGFIFWMLLGFYFLTLALEVRWYFSILFVIVAGAAAYMSLWSYESEIVMIVAFPLVLALHPKRSWLKLGLLSVAWYSVPAVYIQQSIQRYSHSGGHTYQESVLRTSWGVASVLSDWWFNIAFSLEFWKWLRGPWRTSVTTAVLLAALATAVFAAAAWVMVHQWNAGLKRDPARPDARTWGILLAVGFVLLALSFPVFLILNTARMLWRTQLLAGVGAGITLTALAGLASRFLPAEKARMVAFITLSSVVTYAGSEAAIHRGALHRRIWDRHRETIREVLQVAPSVKPNTVIVLTNVPKGDDPFGHDMWYDFGLRLVYPGIDVSGIYYYDDGTAAPGDNLKASASGDLWTWDKTGYPPLVRNASVANTIVVRYDGSGKGTLEESVPAFVCGAECGKLYNPAGLITGPISPRAARRYELDRQP
jgi:hypothetical protein